MLTMLDRLHGESFDFTAFCPDESPLQAQLEKRGVECHPVSFHNTQGQRLSREEVAMQLLPTLQASHFDLLHANSLSMSRMTGALSEQFPPPLLRSLAGYHQTQSGVDSRFKSKSAIDRGL